MWCSTGFHGNQLTKEPNCCSFLLELEDSLLPPAPHQEKNSAAAVFCLSPAIHSECLSRILLLQTWKSSHLLNLCYLWQLWDLSLVSSLGKHRTCRPVNCTPTVSAEHLTGLIWWFFSRYFLGSCTHPRYSWAFGTLKQQCQHPDLRGILSRYSSWGDRYGHRAQGNLCWTSSEKRWEGRKRHCISSRTHPSTTDSEIREGGTQGLQRDTTSTLNTTHPTERVKQGTRNRNDRSCS